MVYTKLKQTKRIQNNSITFDICQTFPKDILNYLENINISNNDIKQYHIYWSESEERICFL